MKLENIKKNKRSLEEAWKQTRHREFRKRRVGHSAVELEGFFNLNSPFIYPRCNKQDLQTRNFSRQTESSVELVLKKHQPSTRVRKFCLVPKPTVENS